MPRLARTMSGTGRYHVMIRGNNGERIFRNNRDILKFLELLAEAKERFSFKIYAYSCMVNHFHMVIKESELGLISRFMHWLETSYSAWFNRVHDRYGHLFQGRFKSKPVESDVYFMNVVRYVHNNPVAAGWCRKAADYKHSSYRCYTGADPGIIDRDEVLALIPADTFEAYHEHEVTNSELTFLSARDGRASRVADSSATNVMRSISACIDGAQLLGMSMEKILETLRTFRKRGLSYKQIADFLMRGKSTVFRLVKRAEEQAPQ